MIISHFLADRTATQYDRLLSSSCRLSVTRCIAALGVGVQGQKLYQRVPSMASSYFSVQTLLL